jgi:hypothetical protein
VSRTAWVPDLGDGPELYQQVEVPEPGDPGWPGADLPEDDPRAADVNQLRAEITADYAAAQAEADLEAWGGRGPSASYAEWLAEGRQEPEAAS